MCEFPQQVVIDAGPCQAGGVGNHPPLAWHLFEDCRKATGDDGSTLLLRKWAKHKSLGELSLDVLVHNCLGQGRRQVFFVAEWH